MTSYLTLDQVWPDLQKGLGSLLTAFEQGKGISSKDWMQMYSQVYNYCTKGQRPLTGPGASLVGEDLYNRVKSLMETHSKKVLNNAQNRSDDALLVYFSKEWDKFTNAIKRVNHIFQYLNKHWIKNAIETKKEVYDVHTLCLVTWRECMFNAIKEQLKSGVLTLIEKERNGEQIETKLVSSVISAFVTLSTSESPAKMGDTKREEKTLSFYKEGFEEDFLMETERYYSNESSSFLAEKNSVADYMKKVEKRLGEEVYRVEAYLHQSTRKSLITRCEQVLIEKHKEILQNEFPKLLEQDMNDDLGRMYDLLHRINYLDPLRSAFEQHVNKIGLGSIEGVAQSALSDPKIYVDTLLSVYRKYFALVNTAFKSDCMSSLEKACRKFINENAVCKLAKSTSKSPELLAKFCDLVLKKSNKNQEEQEMDQLLSDVLVLFKYVEEKDVFMNFYSKFLAKRLIYTTFASEHMEGAMLSKLKTACGYEYTAKLQRMFNDMSTSKDLNERFKGQLVDPGLDFSVLILATGSWPLQGSSFGFSEPKELQSALRSFETFYSKVHHGRKLTWLHHLSKGELKTLYTTTNKLGYTLQASGYQVGVLLQYNQSDSFTLKDLQVATQLAENLLLSVVRSLLKCKVLNASPKVEDIDKGVIDPSTTFTLNKEFKSPKGRIKVNINIQMKSEGGTSEKTPLSEEVLNCVNDERKLLIQAAIVRIMKSRKSSKHANLIAEVVDQLNPRFKPQVTMIKRCIDMLIEKEYLERVKNEKDMYSYVA